MPIDTFKHKGLRKRLCAELRAKGITDESVFDDAQKIYQENAIVTDNTDMLATFTIQRLSPTSQTAQAEEIADMLLSN